MILTIAIVHNAYGKVSGEEIVIDSLAALLAKRGMTVLRFSRFSAEIEDKRLGKITSFFSGIHNPFSRRAFDQFLRETHPDIVHIHNLYPLISPSILLECTAQGIPVVMTVHNFRLACPNGLLLSHGEVCHRCLGGREYWCVLRNCENDIFKSTGYALRTAVARILRRYYDHVNHFLCLSTFQRDLLIKEGLPANRVTILANPMSLASETISNKGKNGYVAYVGRITPEKDVPTLIEAARRLSDLQFKFAGDYHRLPDVIKQKPDNCEFLGQLKTEDIVQFYHNARMVVFATRCYEGFPTVLLEAMSYGLPVVCSRIGGLPEIVDNGITGLLYEPGNADELADRIWTLWQNPALCQKLGEAGKRKVLEDYSAERLLNRLLGIYEKVITEVGGQR
ncbi:MAG: glycosyltransferase family 4 protein [Smithella sp.]|jgi:glycosyltransferase involved in cell wall biosynthesis